MSIADIRADARRYLEICNACRYCEGYCAVFPAVERRRTFDDGDLAFLANLCHDCRSCHQACQYAPPHAFGINLPRAFAELRLDSYAAYAWPGPLARLFHRNGVVVSVLSALALALVLSLSLLAGPSDGLFVARSGTGAFYAVIPYGVMVGAASLTFGFSVLALVMGFLRFLRAGGGARSGIASPLAWARALYEAMTLKNLGGGSHGEGCAYPRETFSNARRRFHHAMFYGFVLCFAATAVATVYDHVLGLVAPYDLFSVPVVLGTVGGVGLAIGTLGLFVLKFWSDRETASDRMLGMDVAFLVLLFFVAVTGLALLGMRETAAMGILLATHLGFVLALFVALPYSKFVHALYRLAALALNVLGR